jgi:hypothetical protein
MDSHHRLQIANRIHLGLMRDLGQGIDVKQMMHSALYARDVLLVCQADPASELQRLGEQFRQATADASARAAEQATRQRRDSSSFALSEPGLPPGHAHADARFDAMHDALQAARRWLAPSTVYAR